MCRCVRLCAVATSAVPDVIAVSSGKGGHVGVCTVREGHVGVGTVREGHVGICTVRDGVCMTYDLWPMTMVYDLCYCTRT